MQRYRFQFRVGPDRIEEYRARHAAVRPDMLRALADADWRNYSLLPQAETSPHVEALDPQPPLQPDQGRVLLELVFHLEDQVTGLGASDADR